MTLHRFFVPREALTGEVITFPPEASHQIARVLRLRPGDAVMVLDGTGWEMATSLVFVGREVTGRITNRRLNEREPETAVTLDMALIKGPKFEMVLQKGTELGACAFVPVVTRRSQGGERGAGRVRRYESIVREAAEQCERGRVPHLAPVTEYAAALAQATERGAVIVLWEDEAAIHLRDAPIQPGAVVSLFVGPEGGFTAEEVQTARGMGAVTVTLGKRILRAETAAIAGLALILARVGELG